MSLFAAMFPHGSNNRTSTRSNSAFVGLAAVSCYKVSSRMLCCEDSLAMHPSILERCTAVSLRPSIVLDLAFYSKDRPEGLRLLPRFRREESFATFHPLRKPYRKPLRRCRLFLSICRISFWSGIDSGGRQQRKNVEGIRNGTGRGKGLRC